LHKAMGQDCCKGHLAFFFSFYQLNSQIKGCLHVRESCEGWTRKDTFWPWLTMSQVIAMGWWQKELMDNVTQNVCVYVKCILDNAYLSEPIPHTNLVTWETDKILERKPHVTHLL
jgi:hypothetical protein